MALNLESLSLTAAFNSIVNFFKSQENNTKWRDLSSSSEGSFLIRLLSNIVSTISYRIVAQSRENYLSTASLISSNIGIAVNLGYSVFRGSNLKRKVKIVANGDYTFPKLSKIGVFSNDYGIYTIGKYNAEGKLEEGDFFLESGEEADISVVVGEVKEKKIVAGTSAIKVFSLFDSGISEDYVLYLDSKEVPTTKVIKDMINDKYLVRTNPYSSVDIVYLNTYNNFKYKYGTDSEFTIRYIELANVGTTPFNSSMFTEYGVMQDYSTISNYIPFEKVEEIKVNAPLDHELQNLIRSKSDYAGRLSEIIPSVIDASYTPQTPTYTLISYLKDDLTLLTKSEVEQVNNILKQENFFGTPLPDITPPRRAVAKLQIDLALRNKYKNISDIQLDINNILSNYYNTALGLTFTTFDLERQLESLSYVKYARVSHALNDRTPGTNYQLGYTLFYNNKYYIASQILGSSGYAEPSWNLPLNPIKEIDTGLETQDGSLIWRAYKKLPNMPVDKISTWKPNLQYGIGEYVVTDQFPNYMFKCVDLMKSTGANSPNLLLVNKGDFIIDGGIVWVVKDYMDGLEWSAYTNFRLGDSVNTTSSNSQYTLECISYTGTVGPVEDLQFEQDTYTIDSMISTAFKVVGDQTYYFRAGDVISASYTGGYTSFSVSNCAYDSSTDITTIKVNQIIHTSLNYTLLYTQERGTRDGQILWKLVDDINSITYDWNVYTTFDYDLDIIGN